MLSSLFRLGRTVLFTALPVSVRPVWAVWPRPSWFTGLLRPLFSLGLMWFILSLLLWPLLITIPVLLLRPVALRPAVSICFSPSTLLLTTGLLWFIAFVISFGLLSSLLLPPV